MTEAQIKLARRAQFLGGYWKQGYKDVIASVESKRKNLALSQAKRAAIVAMVFALSRAERLRLLEPIEQATPARWNMPAFDPGNEIEVMDRLTSRLSPPVRTDQVAYDDAVERLAVYEAKLAAEFAKTPAQKRAEAREERANRGPQGLIDLLKIN